MIRIIYCFALCFISISAYSQTIVIKGGEIHTGLNEEPFVGDILIDGDTILEVSTKSLKGDVVVDASNKIVTPGVIILFDASTTTSPFRDLVETSKIVSPSIRISPTNGSSFSPV